MTISQKQAAVIADLNSQIDWAAKITRIIAYGADLPAYPTDAEYSAERFVVRAADCSTRTYFLVGRSGQNQYIRAKSNATIPLGLAGLLHYIYNGQPLNDVADFTPTFITACGLDTHLTVGQLNLLNAMMGQIYDFIHDVPMADEPTPQEEINRLAIVALQTRATTDEGLISANAAAITTEATNRQNADAALQTAVNNEVAARGAADTALQGDIDTEEAARIAADAALQTAVNNEVAARQTADATLQTAVNNEVAQRQAADTALQDNITTEATQRQSADATLQTNINNEAAARQTADARIEGKVDALTPAQQGSAGQVLTIGEDGTTKIWKTPDIGGIEDVTVQLSVEGGQGSVVGVNVAVQVEGENQPRQYVSDAQGKVQFNVSFGLQYQITFAAISGYITAQSLTYRAALLTRNVYGVYREDATQTQEHVTLILNYTTGGSARAESIKVQTNAGTTTYAVVNNRCEFNVALGASYTIKYTNVDGYATPIDQTFTAVFAARYLNVSYIGAVLDLCWVKISDGTTIPFEDISMAVVTDIAGLRISSSLLAQQSASFLVPMEYLIMNSIVNDGTTLVTAKSIGSKTWGPQQLLYDLPCYTSAAAATTSDSTRNFDGENNTSVYLAEAASRGLTLPAMAAARAISYTINGVEKFGFLGSYAQLKAFADNYTNIHTALRGVFNVGCIQIASGYWWTSTQYSQTIAVYLSYGGFGSDYKTYSYSVVPFLAY